MKNLIKCSLVLAALLVLNASPASAEKPENKIARNSRAIYLDPLYSDFFYDQEGNLATDGDTPIFTNAALECDHNVPVIAPDGHHVTLAEWSKIRGEGHAICRGDGTLVRLKLKGLLPNGVYSIWLGIFDPPGITPDFSTWTGFGALGSPDGGQNHFVASAKGEGEVLVLHPAGALSIFGEVTDCMLENSEVVAWVVLHMDGQTHGPVPHPDGVNCTLAGQGGFGFKQ